MAQLAISNIINISVSQSNLGVNAYNTSNLGLFTDEIPANSFGTLGYNFYVDPTGVAADFGTASKTYQMALAVFSQQPNILTGNGQLVIILMTPAIQTLALSGVPASGAFTISYGGNTTTSLAYTSTAGQIQTALQLLPGLAGVTVSGSLASESVIVHMGGVYGAAPATFTFPANTLMTSVPASITITPTISTAGETLAAAITAASSLVAFFGIIVDQTVTQIGSVDVAAAAAVVQALNKIAFFVSYAEADIQAAGILTDLQTGSFTHSRGLYYGDPTVGADGYIGLNAVLMATAYAGRALSVNFSGSNTTITMNLKTLNTIQPDPSMTQSIYNEAKIAGADIYPSIQGDPAVISFGANSYFDNVYNLLWFVGAIQVAGFNYLAQTGTKVPQTETGMDGLKGAYSNVCNQGKNNQYIAPGSWTSSTTFGNQPLLYQNIAQQGYYIFSQPIAQQSQVDRMARQAPLVQIGIKLAGAIQESNVIVFVNE